jgi:hypothetical protein
MVFNREKQDISASQLLQVLADGEDIHLRQCTITGVLDVNRLFDSTEKFNIANLSIVESQDCKLLILSQSIVFDKCIFEENTVFAAPWQESDVIAVEFKAPCIFNSSVFKEQTRFVNAVFHEDAGFDGCSFGGFATFKNTIFHKDAKFRTVLFSGYCLFGNATFNASARFSNSHFAKGVNFSGAKFLDQIDFGGVYSSNRAVPIYESIFFSRRKYGDDESFWRFVKQSAQEAGYYQLAGECFYNERCACLWQKWLGASYDKLPAFKKLARLLAGVRLLPELIFGRLLFGYGERPVRVLVASALIITFCAFLYSQPGILFSRIGPDQHSFLQGLYFSVITFTTLGYGDLYPAPASYCRPLAMAEAISGGLLMALFVVCLAKRFSRG